MTRPNRLASAAAIFLLSSAAAWAQSTSSPEREEALHVRPRPGQEPKLLKDGTVNEWFIYEYTEQTIPVVDDFSVDRTQHFNAQNDDPNVSLFETIYLLQVNGQSTADMVFFDDTTFHYTEDIGLDTSYYSANPTIEVVIFDLDEYPPTTDTLELWPWYAIYDTIGDPTSDTLDLLIPANYVQDSLMVYTVAANTGIYMNPDNTPRPLILWEEDEAYVNGTYPVDPPTIGVASFDGMDRTGFPYQPETPNNAGDADHLTSVPINWGNPPVTPGDSVYLSFFYQNRGLSGDVDIDPNDSLWLEFYSPSQDEWFLEWSADYGGLAPFKQVMIPITYEGFLQNGFRMRFTNRASLGGPVDFWHIDYVRLGKNRSISDTLIQDIAWIYPANTLLAPYTSVPFNKFTGDPALYMADSIDLVIGNLFNVSTVITWKYDVGGDCVEPASRANYGSSIAGNAGTTFTTNHPINSGDDPYKYNLDDCTDAAFAEVKFTAVEPYPLRYNDTTRFTQEISNYYAYDDGSAESGYWLNSNGGRIAYRFDTQGSDSLRAVRMYFDPIFTFGDIPNDPRDGSFLITVWSDLNSDPIFQNISFSSPEYMLWGPNHFVEYPLDSTIAVGGTFYVGWTQTNAVKMNLGIDKNRVNNDRMNYNVGSGWLQSGIEGSWMLRPVMVSEVDPFASVEETPQEDRMTLFPNPAGNELNLRFSGAAPQAIEILDATGRMAIRNERWAGHAMSLASLSPGMYVVRALDGEGRALAQQRLVVQR